MDPHNITIQNLLLATSLVLIPIEHLKNLIEARERSAFQEQKAAAFKMKHEHYRAFGSNVGATLAQMIYKSHSVLIGRKESPLQGEI